MGKKNIFSDSSWRTLCPPFTPMHKILSPAKNDEYRIDIFHVNEDQARFQNLRDAINAARRRGVIHTLTPGDYAGLYRTGVVMTDTPNERATCKIALTNAQGEVMHAGLGIGMLAVPTLAKPEVKSLTIFEIEQKIIDLVLPQLQAKLPKKHLKKLKVVQGDIFEVVARDYRHSFDSIWFDIWPTINGDNWPEMKRLHRKFRIALKPGGTMESWCQWYCKYDHNQG